MSASSSSGAEPLAGWDPRRRAALEAVWHQFREAAGDVSLSDELIADRRREAAAEDDAQPAE
jgi:hypothetical protein